jgi:DNA-binding transcriptional MocR family regulator
MNGLSTSERLEKQRTLRDWLAYQLAQAERAIRALEAEEAEEKRRREVARREMSWKVVPSRAVEGYPSLHRGNCPNAKNMPSLLSRDEVKTAFEQFPELEMCDLCAPWGSLGIDKPTPRRPGGGAP